MALLHKYSALSKAQAKNGDFAFNGQPSKPGGPIVAAIENRSTTESIEVKWTFDLEAKVNITQTFSGGITLKDVFELKADTAVSIEGSIKAGVEIPLKLGPGLYAYPVFHWHYHENQFNVDHYKADGFDNTYAEGLAGPGYGGFAWSIPASIKDIGG